MMSWQRLPTIIRLLIIIAGMFGPPYLVHFGADRHLGMAYWLSISVGLCLCFLAAVVFGILIPNGIPVTARTVWDMILIILYLDESDCPMCQTEDY